MAKVFDLVGDVLFYLRVEAEDQYRFLWINQAFLDSTGMAEDQIVGKPIDEVIPAPAIEMVRRHYKEAIEERRTVRWDETSTYSGEEKIGLVSVSPVFDDEATCTNLVGVVRDITDRTRLERARAESQNRLGRMFVDTIGLLSSAFESRDLFTAGHQQRVAALGMAIAEEMGLSAERADGVYFGGLVHDIGKLSVPMEILNRPGELSELEFAMIKEHPRTGLDIISRLEFPWPIREIVGQHHERLDGSGYPDGLREGEIVEEALIIAVADVVEAMGSHRPYRPKLGIEAALEEVTKNRGTLFLPTAVDACQRLFVDNRYSLDDFDQTPSHVLGTA